MATVNTTRSNIVTLLNQVRPHNFKIRTVTLGLNLNDCVDSNSSKFKERVYEKISKYSRLLVNEASKLEDKYKIPIVHKRISVTPISLITENLETKELIDLARVLDCAAKDSGIDLIGGYGALVQKGMTKNDIRLLESFPLVLSETERLCCFTNVASNTAGMNMDAIIKMGAIIKEVANKTNGRGCLRLVVFANAPEDNPFMPGAFHGIGESDTALNVAISGSGFITSSIEKSGECELAELSSIIKEATRVITVIGEHIGRELAKNMGVSFGIVDISLASTHLEGDSVGQIMEAMGLERVGSHGSTAALALLMGAVKRGGAMGSEYIGGLSGTILPVTEDKGLAEAVKNDALSLDKLEAMTAVCSVGLDMFAVPGEIPAETISAIIADELSIGVINNKSTAVRIIPVPGAKPGEWIKFGGVFGEGPVMRYNKFSSKKFINRGGRFPRPISSMRN